MRRRLWQLALVNALLMVGVGLLSPNFLRSGNLLSLLNNMALEAIALAAVALLLVGGQIDLSLDGAIAMTGVVAGKLLTVGVHPYPAALAGLLSGGLLGLANGTLINRYRLNPLITTLGTGWCAYGVAYGLTQGSSFYAFPPAYQQLGQAQVAGVRLLVLWAALLTLLLTGVLERTLLGAHVYLVGDNADSAALMGVDVAGVRRTLYVLAGLTSGLVGVLLSSRLDAATPIAADGLALRVIAAAVIGGCSLQGGYGSLVGSVLGLLLMNTLANAAVIVGVSVYWQKAITGGVLLLATVLDASGLRFKLNLGKEMQKWRSLQF